MACPTNYVDHGTPPLPLPLTAARSGYLGALAHRDEYTAEQLEWLRRQADEDDELLAECLIPPTVPWREQLAREGRTASTTSSEVVVRSLAELEALLSPRTAGEPLRVLIEGPAVADLVGEVTA